MGVLVSSLVAGLLYQQGADLWLVGVAWLGQVGVLIGIAVAMARLLIHKQQSLEDQRISVQASLLTTQQAQETLRLLAIELAAARTETEISQALFKHLSRLFPLAWLELTLADAASDGWIQMICRPDGSLSSVLLASAVLADFRLQPGRSAAPDILDIPIAGVGQRLGNLLVKRSVGAFSAGEEQFVSVAASLSTLCLQTIRLHMEINRQQITSQARSAELHASERALHLLLGLTEAAASMADFAGMLQAFVDRLGETFRMDGALIFLWDERHNQPRPVAAYGPLRQVFRTLQLDLNDMPFLKTIQQTGELLVLGDTNRALQLRARSAAQLHARSLLGLPLFAGNVVVGVVALTTQNEHVFNPQELELSKLAARQIGLAIARAQALQIAQYRAQELGALQRATSVLMSNLELESLLGQILDAAISAIPAAERGALHLIARDTGQLQVRAVHGYRDTRIRTLSLTTGSSQAARSVHERRPILIEDAQEGNGIASNLPELGEAGSSIIAPLLVGQDALGAISLDCFQRYAFSQNDLQLLVSFAATAATAIHNAQLHGEVQKQAITDTLTGLYNRRGFIEFGRREVERAIRFVRPLTALMLDLDNFKDINDHYGHLFGDKVLIGVTQRWSQELRQIDLLGRYGGDEFIILLPETNLESAVQVAERLRQKVSQMGFPIGPSNVRLTMSVGVSALDEATLDLETLVQKADHALYEAKRAGRNQVISA